MPHSMSLIATVAAAFGLALLLGIAAARARMPALVGYLVAGVIIGPATPGFVADLDAARQLANARPTRPAGWAKAARWVTLGAVTLRKAAYGYRPDP